MPPLPQGQWTFYYFDWRADYVLDETVPAPVSSEGGRSKAWVGRKRVGQEQSTEAPGDKIQASLAPRKGSNGNWEGVCQTLCLGCLRVLGTGGGRVGLSMSKSLCLIGGAVAQQVPVQAIQVHQTPQQASPSRDSSTDLTQTSSSGTGIA